VRRPVADLEEAAIGPTSARHGSAEHADALAALDVTVFFGEIKFDPRGINIYKPMVVEQIQNGVHHTVFPLNDADAKPMYPTPAWDQR